MQTPGPAGTNRGVQQSGAAPDGTSMRNYVFRNRGWLGPILRRSLPDVPSLRLARKMASRGRFTADRSRVA